MSSSTSVKVRESVVKRKYGNSSELRSFLSGMDFYMNQIYLIGKIVKDCQLKELKIEIWASKIFIMHLMSSPLITNEAAINKKL